jgi:hypothetical protein
MKNLHGWTKSALIILVLVLLQGCKPEFPPSIKTKMLEPKDFPKGWLVFRETSGLEWGGKSYNIGFDYGTKLEDPGIGHGLIVYPDGKSAVSGFEEYKSIFTQIWKEPIEADFTPMMPEDLIEYKCVKSLTNGKLVQDCLVIQQHGNFISAIDATIGEPITFDVLNSILKSIDEKLNKSK